MADVAAVESLLSTGGSDIEAHDPLEELRGKIK
jgi:hypothetical protein